ncbi:MAG: helix-turn-helix domain-containing protein [Eubacteriaceae bacterium]
MRFLDLKRSLDAAKPQFQPWLCKSVNHYIEKTIKLNPVSIKANSFFYQFTAVDEQAIDIVADLSPTFIFICDAINPYASFWGINNRLKIMKLKKGVTYFCVKPYSLFGTKAWKLSPEDTFGKKFELEDVISQTNALPEQIAKAQSFDERISLFRQHYLDHWVDYDYKMSLQEYIACIIYLQHMNFSVSDLEEITGYSERYCRKKFVNAYSLSPKKYLNVFRFQNAMRMLTDQNQMINITDIANENGYYDESHFINDFKTYTKISPEQFRKDVNGLFVPQ